MNDRTMCSDEKSPEEDDGQEAVPAQREQLAVLIGRLLANFMLRQEATESLDFDQNDGHGCN